ncbi:MAG: helix-turn-helix transcriptional regulator [Ignavibacteria bacterium]|nr:helix-turn-helix transcriptional regulator [Ignavibacteria bacterium]
MSNSKIIKFTLNELKDEFIGKPETKARQQYEYKLQMDVLGRLIKKARLMKQLTQEELGKLIGVKKAQISKLESSANSATIDTVLRVFNALEAEVYFNVRMGDRSL